MELNIPHRNRDDSLADVGGLAGRLGDPQEAEVVRELVAQAHQAGARTAGDLLDILDRANPAQRRELVDNAREITGQPTATVMDERAAFAAANASRVPQPRGDVPSICAVCSAVAVDAQGLPRSVNVRRWYCEEHRDQAE